MSVWPEPGSAANAGRIAVLVAHNRGRDGIAEHISRDAARKFRIKVAHVRQAAAQHDDVRVEYIDHHRQPARQPVGVAVDRRDRSLVTRSSAGRQSSGIVGAGSVAVTREGRTGDVGFQAAVLAAPAKVAGDLDARLARATVYGPTPRRSGAGRGGPCPA